MVRYAVSLLAAALVVIALHAQAPEGAGAAKAKGRGKAQQTEAAPTPPPVPQVLRLVRPNTYLVTGHGSNATFRVTPQGVLLVNTKLPAPGDYDRLMELIRGVSAQPVRFIFNTDASPDSAGNNARFAAAGAEIVTTERSVTLGGATVRSVRAGQDTAVYFPAEKLICIRDPRDPAALDAILKLDWTLAVPATGEPVYRTAVEKLRK